MKHFGHFDRCMVYLRLKKNWCYFRKFLFFFCWLDSFTDIKTNLQNLYIIKQFHVPVLKDDLNEFINRFSLTR